MLQFFHISDILFWIYFIYFLLASLVAFYFPGDVLIRNFKISVFSRMVLAFNLGIVLFALQGFLFGFMGMRWLSYLYIVLFFLLWIIYRYSKVRKEICNKKINFDRISALLIFFGILIQLLMVWYNGFLNAEGVAFCCGHLYDGLFHISLTNQIINNFPPFEPGLGNVIVRNYHYASNVIVAELIRVFNLPLIASQNQFFTFLISILLGLNAIVFCNTLNLPKSVSRWLLIFLYFGGDFLFLTLLFLGKGLSFSMSSMEDGTKFLINPPRALSIVLFFSGLTYFYIWIKSKKTYAGILMALILGSLISFKVYVGIFSLVGLGFVGLYFLFNKKFIMITPLLFALFLSLLLYLPVNKDSGGLIYTGFWRFEDFIVHPALDLSRLELALKIYWDHSNWIRVGQYEIFFILLYTFSIFGSKIIGLFQSRKSLSLLPIELNILLISGIVSSFILGSFFCQMSGGTNTFNFLVSVFLIGSIYSSIACYYWLKKVTKTKKIILTFIIIVLTIPRVLQVTFSIDIPRITNGPGFVISYDELNASEYLRNKSPKDSMLLVDHRFLGIDNETPYVSFLANRPIFLSGINSALDGHGIDYSDRKRSYEIIFESFDASSVAAELKHQKINYILTLENEWLTSTASSRFLKEIYKNKSFKVLKVDKEVIDKYQ